MRTATLILGEPGVGKSTYIYKNHKEDDILDMYCFQNPLAFPIGIDRSTAIFVGQALFEREIYDFLYRARMNEEDYNLVVEGTYLKKARRAPLIQTIRNVGDVTIDCVFLTEDGKTLGDIPTEDEGYDSLQIIDRKELVYTDDEIRDSQEFTDKRRAIDYITENDLLLYRHVATESDSDMDKFERLFSNKMLFF